MSQSRGTRGTRKLLVESDRLLLVEGLDEVNLFNALISRCMGDGPQIQIIEAGGIGKFPSSLQAIRTGAKTGAGLKSVGVVRDADNGPQAAFQSVCGQLRNADFDPPDSHGTFSSGTPSVGVFIVPSDTEAGAIETLCRRSVEGSDTGRCAEEFLHCLQQRDALQSTIRDKSFAHAYLASTLDPVARVGEGAFKGVWDFDSPAFKPIRNFISSLQSC